MNEIILLKLGELVLKGLNRHTFEEKLMSNARRRLPANGRVNVYNKHYNNNLGPPEPESDIERAFLGP